MNRETYLDRESPVDQFRPMLIRPIDVSADDELEFQVAMEQYKRRSGRQFPTWSEILEVLGSIGYAKRIWRPVGPWSPLPESSIEDDSAGIVGWFARAETPVEP